MTTLDGTVTRMICGMLALTWRLLQEPIWALGEFVVRPVEGCLRRGRRRRIRRPHRGESAAHRRVQQEYLPGSEEVAYVVLERPDRVAESIKGLHLYARSLLLLGTL